MNGGLEVNYQVNLGYIEQEIHDQTVSLLDYLLYAHPVYANEQIDLPEYWSLQPQAEKLLLNLGFKESDFYRPLSEFSGGWQMRANLAKALFVPSDIILFDEPTNHLDLQMREEICMALQDFDGAVIIVSHDKFLLQGVVDQFYIVNNKSLIQFDGSLDEYYEML